MLFYILILLMPSKDVDGGICPIVIIKLACRNNNLLVRALQAIGMLSSLS